MDAQRQWEQADAPRNSSEPPVAAQAWMDEARCRGKTDVFFAAFGERPEARAVREAKARAVCRSCPVIMQCRRWAREHREYGFWGGESEVDRAKAGYFVSLPIGQVARVIRLVRREGSALAGDTGGPESPRL